MYSLNFPGLKFICLAKFPNFQDTNFMDMLSSTRMHIHMHIWSAIIFMHIWSAIIFKHNIFAGA